MFEEIGICADNLFARGDNVHHLIRLVVCHWPMQSVDTCPTFIVDTKNCTGILMNCIDEIAHNAVAIRWNPREPMAKVSIALLTAY